MSVKFNPNDKIAACGMSDGLVRIYNVREGAMVMELSSSAKEHSPVTAVHWRPENV